MNKYKKKPIIVEAIQFTGENYLEIAEWAGGNNKISLHFNGIETFLKLSTLEGDMFADIEDWIIKGIKSEFYPCKPDIFEETYELVEE